MATCTVDSLVQFIRENAADCLADRKKRSDFYVTQAICLAVQQVVKDKSDDFQEVVEITLKNGECAQSSCSKCSGIVKVVGNVNGSCEDPISVSQTDSDNNSHYSKYYSVCADENATDEYTIDTFEILGDGGCYFKVEPKVPDIGVHKVNVLCVVTPDVTTGEIPEQLCRHFYLVAAKALFWIYTYEADPAMATKATVFDAAYQRWLAEDRQVNRDVFLKSLVFGARTNSTDE